MHAVKILQLIIVSALRTACEKQLSSAEKQQQSLQQAGFDASLAATFMVRALRSCYIAGYSQLYLCSENTGNLLPETTAKMLAQLALEQRKSYLNVCQKSFQPEYCESLLDRAFAMAWRRPPVDERQSP